MGKHVLKQRIGFIKNEFTYKIILLLKMEKNLIKNKFEKNDFFVKWSSKLDFNCKLNCKHGNETAVVMFHKTRKLQVKVSMLNLTVK